MTTIYVLHCKSDKYYVGSTNRPIEKRLEEHFANNGSEWTKLYTPINVVKVIPNSTQFDEDKYVKIYMEEFGIDNVRGGSYSQIILPEYKRKSLVDELCTAENKCFVCHQIGHYANKCPTICSKNSHNFKCKYCERKFLTHDSMISHEKCCFNNTKISMFQWIKNITCEIPNISKRASDEIISPENTCFRCGRIGHFANNCCAKYHVNGKKL